MKGFNFTRLSNAYQGQVKSQNNSNSIEVLIMNIAAVYINIKIYQGQVDLYNCNNSKYFTNQDEGNSCKFTD